MTEQKLVYLDNNATTPVDPEVLDAMLPFLKEDFGNAASVNHQFGWKAAGGVENARKHVADLIGTDPKSIIWTSGATESDNLAIKGVAQMYHDKGNHIITCKTEHKAVLDTCGYLESQGFEVTYLEVDEFGVVDTDVLAETITDKTILISIMAANNETGSIHPIAEIGRIAHERGVLFHCDGAQAVGKIPINVEAMQIDLLSISAHKMYGPKGVGVLYVRRSNPSVRLGSQMHGGGHERQMRSGTLNVPGIVGMGAAAEIAGKLMAEESARLRMLRDTLAAEVTLKLDYVKLNGHLTQRLPNTLNLSFDGAEGESIIQAMGSVACSTGSACTTSSHERNHVLSAMGVSERLAQGAIRFSLGRFNTEAEIDLVISKLIAAVELIRKISGFSEHDFVESKRFH